MAVTRYEWTCPGCGKRFAVREGMTPALCPGCQSTVAPAPVEQPQVEGSAPVPSPAFAAWDDLADDFVSRPRSAPPTRRRSTADKWVWTIDLRFERFLTPHFIRAIWVLGVAAGMTVAIVDICRTASRAWSPQPAAVDAPRVGEQVAWNFGLLTARLVAVFVAVMAVRVSCEGAIVIFRMADSLEAIREAAARQSAQQNE
jgi:hypothetical protein